MKLHKLLMAAITSILGIILLSGCGKNIGEISTNTKETTNSTTTIITTVETIPLIKGQASTESMSEVEQVEKIKATSQTADNIYYEIPYGDTSFYAYMDWQAITDCNSPQYQLLSQGWTDSQGIRRVGDDVCIALGSYYSTNIGDRFLITLDSGNSYTAILGDCKADCDTDYTNRYRAVGNGKINVVEFIVDINSLNYSVRNSGSIGSYDNYSGQIVSIEKIE